MPDFYADYLVGNAALRPFFAHGVRELAAASEALPSWNTEFRAALLEDQARLGLQREFPAEALAVVTGQQPGLFGGPLYTIYKAITAIKLAQKVEQDTGRACVPVFWAAADDHDFDEVRTAHLLSLDHTHVPLRYEPEGDVAALPMHGMPAQDSLQALIERMSAEAAGGEFREEVKAFLLESLRSSRSFSDWFCRIMARLFRDTPLVIFTTELPAARIAAAPVFETAIHFPLEATRLLNAAGEKLAALGYAAQVVKAADECAFFVQVEGRRRKVTFSDGVFHLPEIRERRTEAEMLAWLASRPEDFSANVALRPIVQQALFPAAAYIGGPGELAYWAQFQGIFQFFNQPMPVVYPRSQAVLTTIKLNKLLAKYNVTPSELTAPKEELVQRALRASVKSPALDTFRAERVRVESATQSLSTAVLGAKKIDKQSADAVRTAGEQILSTLDRLEKALLRADDGQAETVRKQIERLCTAFAPDRKPQERVYSVFSYLFEQGWGLIDRLGDALDIESFAMNEIEL